MGKFSVIVCPCSDQERDFNELIESGTAFDDLQRKARMLGIDPVQRVDFDTLKERDAFIKGYSTGIGYHGYGIYVTHDS